MLQLSIPSELNVRWYQEYRFICCRFICCRQRPLCCFLSLSCAVALLVSEIVGSSFAPFWTAPQVHPFSILFHLVSLRYPETSWLSDKEQQFKWNNMIIDHPLPLQAFQLVSLLVYYLLPTEAPTPCAPMAGQTAIKHSPLKKTNHFMPVLWRIIARVIATWIH